MQRLDGEILIYDLVRNKAFCLNETSALVYELCDGTNTVADIAGAIGRTAKRAVPDDVVLIALDQLQREELLDVPRQSVFETAGTTRRDALKTIGTASMIALPIITGLIAPLPAAAQSPGGFCATQFCDCSDAFVIANPPGTECTGANLVIPCASPSCRCFVRDNDPIGTDVCA